MLLSFLFLMYQKLLLFFGLFLFFGTLFLLQLVLLSCKAYRLLRLGADASLLHSPAYLALHSLGIYSALI